MRPGAGVNLMLLDSRLPNICPSLTESPWIHMGSWGRGQLKLQPGALNVGESIFGGIPQNLTQIQSLLLERDVPGVESIDVEQLIE
jgi:hypothetical protein